PDDVAVGGVWDGEAGFASTEVVLPLPATTAAASAETAASASAGVAHAGHVGSGLHHVAGAAHGAVVLHVAVDLVGHVVIDGDVIDLADGESDARRCLAVVGGH